MLLMLAMVAGIGQLLVVLAGIPHGLSQIFGPLTLLLLGRCLLGFGIESMGVAQSTLTCQWYRSSKRLGLALSLNVAMARMGAIVNDILSPAVVVEWEEKSDTWVHRLARWFTSWGVPDNWLTSGVIVAGWLSVALGALTVLSVVAALLFDIWIVYRQCAQNTMTAAPNNDMTGSQAAQPPIATEETVVVMPTSNMAGTSSEPGLSRPVSVSRTAATVAGPSTATAAALTLHKLPFRSVRQQPSARDVRAMRRSYLCVDGLNRRSGFSNRRIRPSLHAYMRQRSATDDVARSALHANWLASTPNELAQDMVRAPSQTSAPEQLLASHRTSTASLGETEALVDHTWPNTDHVEPLIGDDVGHQGRKRRSTQTTQSSRGAWSTVDIGDLSYSLGWVPANWQFWFSCFSMVCFYSAVTPFVNIGKFTIYYTHSPCSSLVYSFGLFTDTLDITPCTDWSIYGNP
jgi:hypothetical protein